MQQLSIDEVADAESTPFVHRTTSAAPFPTTPAARPVSASSLSQAASQRQPRDVGPQSGRVQQIRTERMSLFAADDEDTPASVEIVPPRAAAVAPTGSVESRMLTMGAERIAADKDRARRFIMSQ